MSNPRMSHLELTESVSTENRRWYTRYDVSVPVTVWRIEPADASAQTPPAPVPAEIINLGAGGCRVRSSRAYPIDSDLGLEFVLGEHRVALVGRVQYRQNEAIGNVPRWEYGIHFARGSALKAVWPHIVAFLSTLGDSEYDDRDPEERLLDAAY